MTMVGCQSQPPTTTTLDGKTPNAAANFSLSDDASTLCLADPHDDSPLDVQLRTSQRQARALPGDPYGWVLLGRTWVRKARSTSDPGFYLNVNGCVEMALRAAPGYRAALNLRGLALMNDHKFTEALAVADAILREEPKDLVALGIRSDALLELGRFDDAADAGQEMMDLRPDMASYARASYFRWLAGDSQTAKVFIRSALNAGRDRRDPEPTAWNFVQAGMLSWHEGDYEGADKIFIEALNWVSDYPSALVGRARVALSLQQPERAIEYLEKAYNKAPLTETVWLLGDAREMLGDSAGANAEYQRVVQEGRRSDRLTLALFYATKDRDHDEALRLIEEERHTRGGVYIEDVYAWVLYRLGRIQDARQASERALSLGTQDARLLYHAGTIFLAAGEHSGQQLIQKALALNPKFDRTGAAEATTLLGAYAKNFRKF